MSMRHLGLLAGPLVAVCCAFFLDIPQHPHAPTMVGIAVWMAIWWLMEAVPLALTALIPMFAFPLFGVAPASVTAPHYINSIIFLFIGGFLIAQGMEETGLHKRLALEVLVRLHASPLRLAAGFAFATAFLSMWVSNTASTMLMLTIALPLLGNLIEQHGRDAIAPFAAALMLVIAYSANLGGIATPVGTPPNLVFFQTVQSTTDHSPSFLQWMVVGLPVTVAGLLVLFFWLWPSLRNIPWAASDARLLSRALQQLGPMRREEVTIACVLGCTALLWITRTGIEGDGWHVPGWSSLLPYPGLDDGSVAILGAASLFLLRDRRGNPILTQKAFGKIPWDVVILLGGGFALAFGMQSTGLTQWLGQSFAFLANLPMLWTMLAVSLIVTLLTEITSNTAVAQVTLPILAAAAASNGLDPYLLLLPATMSASCAFMLPVATPPNAIVFGSRFLHIRDMVRLGLKMNLSMLLIVVLFVYLLRPFS